MSTYRRSVPDDVGPSGSVSANESGRHDAEQRRFAEGQQTGSYGGPGGSGSSRKKRRRQRSQRGKGRRPSQGMPSHRIGVESRERMFQDIEGLLRQIREEAEESTHWTEEQLRDITQTVTGFTKSLEEEGDPVSERTVHEYKRIREKLSQALRGDARGA